MGNVTDRPFCAFMVAEPCSDFDGIGFPQSVKYKPSNHETGAIKSSKYKCLVVLGCWNSDGLRLRKGFVVQIHNHER